MRRALRSKTPSGRELHAASHTQEQITERNRGRKILASSKSRRVDPRGDGRAPFGALRGAMKTIIKSATWRRNRPVQRRQLNTNRVKPSELARPMAVVPLRDATDVPSIVSCRKPTDTPARAYEPTVRECVACFGMLKHTTTPPHGCERRHEAPAVVAELAAHLGARAAAPVPSPPVTRGMRNNRERAAVQPRVPRLIPRVHARQTEIDTPCSNEKSGYITHRRPDHVHPLGPTFRPASAPRS
jgi:hypothetical protein